MNYIIDCLRENGLEVWTLDKENNKGIGIDLDFNLDIFEEDEEIEEIDTSIGTIDDETYKHLTEETIENPKEVVTNVETELKYPSLTVEGVKLNFEIDRIRDICEEEGQLPLYVRVGDNLAELGRFNLTLENILRMLEIRKYDVYINTGENTKEIIGGDLISTLLLG